MASRVVVTYHTPVVAAGITGVGGLQPEVLLHWSLIM